VSPPRETWIAKLIAAAQAEAKVLDSVRTTRSRIANVTAGSVQA
jgi:hypothetical protein